ncbi:G-protein coupled receptor 151 [Esox lucius]|uniref:G-protein coupled receptors family 1 profile domain-containing protein n=1 Tax=Esox lucius TaxID=8010 RepID=A0A3P8X7N4_ESOLU|nr:G-protein coupled receptor 151 [Esox lucius]
MDFDRPKNVSFFDFAGGVQLLRGEAAQSVLPVLLTCLCVTGTVGNVLVLLGLIHHLNNGRASELKALLASLSATDMGILLLCAPVRAVTYYRETWTLGGFMCQTADWFQNTCLVAKTFTLAATTTTRRRVGSPGSRGGDFSPVRVYGVLVFIWTVALVFSAPLMVFTSLQPYHNVTLCVTEIPLCASGLMDVFTKTYPTLSYVVPIIFTIGHYVRTLHASEPKAGHCVAPQGQGVSVALLCVSGANAFLLLPEWSSWAWARLGYRDSYTPPVGFVIFSQVLMFSSSCLTPVIFLTMYEEVRRSAWLSLTCRSSKQGGVPAGSRAESARNRVEQGAIVVYPLVELKRASFDSPTGRSLHTEDASSRKIFPDVELFWTERVNKHDPIPWETQEEKTYIKS